MARLGRLLADPSNHDTVYKVLNRAFNQSSGFNLKRTDEVRYEIVDLARKRSGVIDRGSRTIPLWVMLLIESG